MLDLDNTLTFNRDLIEAPNLLDRLTEDDRKKLGNHVWEGFVRDKQSRRDWEERNNAGMDLAMQIQREKNFPWPNCSNIVFPLVSIGALQFSTRSYSQLIRGSEVYKYRIYGQDPDGKLAAQAHLMGRHMSWQCLEQDQAWEEQHDRLFINVSIVGTTFIKTQFSPVRNHNLSTMVQAKNLVVNYWARSVEECPRKTEIVELYRNDIYSRAKRGVYSDVTNESWFQEAARYGLIDDINRVEHDKRVGLAPPQGDQDTPFTSLEQHCYLDLDKDGYLEPYTCLIESVSRCPLRLVARTEREEDVERNSRKEIVSIKATEYYTKYGFIPAADGGFYDTGFGVLIGPLNEATNSAVNQIFDAGTSNMLGGGFVSTGAKMKSGVYTRTPGEWKIIKGAAEDIRKSLVSFPEIPISDVVFKLLQFVVSYADRLAGTVEVMAGENPGQNTPAQTYQGMIEQGTQIYRSIFKRMWRSMKEEGKKLHQLNARFLPVNSRFGEGGERITAELYKSDPDLLVPTADPDLVSDQARMNKAAVVRQGAMQVPGYDLEEAERRWLQAMGEENIEKLYPGPYSKWYQEHPLPNPKAALEQMKLQGKEMQFKYKMQETVMKLQAERGKVKADIELLQAQAAKLISEIGADRAAHQLEAFDVLMTHLTSMADTMNQRIEALMGQSEGDQGGTETRGTGRDQESSGGQGTVQLAQGQSGQPAGAVGTGEVSQ